jgi:hypothetical protein
MKGNRRGEEIYSYGNNGEMEERTKNQKECRKKTEDCRSNSDLI